MMIPSMLFLGLATATTAQADAAWLAAASERYETCIFRAIDQQYLTGRFSEKAVLSACAAIRRLQVKAAERAVAGTTASPKGEAMIRQEFERLDQSV